jgi:hypothetical protein
VSFGMSIFWISAISYGMVDAAASVGCILDIPEAGVYTRSLQSSIWALLMG